MKSRRGLIPAYSWAILMCWGFRRKAGGSIPLAKVASFAVGYGLFIEAYQGLLPWRSFGVDDMVWNTAGAVFVVVVLGAARGLGNYFLPQMDADKHGWSLWIRLAADERR